MEHEREFSNEEQALLDEWVEATRVAEQGDDPNNWDRVADIEDELAERGIEWRG